MLIHFESQQSSTFRELKPIFYVIKAHVALSNMIIPDPGQKVFYHGKPSVFFNCPKFGIPALCIYFRLASQPVCFWLFVCFCICLWFALDFACIVQHLPVANRRTCVWHAFTAATGRRVCVSCSTHASFERGLICIPRLALEVRCWFYRYEVAYFRRIYLRCIVCW